MLRKSAKFWTTIAVFRKMRGNPFHAATIDGDMAAVWLLEPGDQAKQCRFTAPRRPDDGHELAGVDGEVYPAHNQLTAVGPGHPLKESRQAFGV